METTQAIAQEDFDVITPIGDRNNVEISVTVHVSTDNALRKSVDRNVTLERESAVTVSVQNRKVIEARQVDR